MGKDVIAFAVIVERKKKWNPIENRWGIGEFPDVNRIGRPKAVTSIPILLGH